MNLLKNALTPPPVFTPLNTTGYTTLDTDTCEFQVSGVLLQLQLDGTTNPSGYLIRFLTHAERKYNTTQLKRLANVWTKLLPGPYLEGTRFNVCTIYKSLTRIHNLTDKTRRLAYWRSQLFEFELYVVYGAGVKHQAVDALSRLQTNGDYGTSFERNSSLLPSDTINKKSIMLLISANGDETIPLDSQKKNQSTYLEH